MSYTHTLGITYRTADGPIATTTAAYVGDSEYGIDGTVPADSGAEFDLGIPLGDIRSVMLWCDKDALVLTNDPDKPQDTIVLAAGRQLVWTWDSPVAAPFANDVTKFFVLNGDDAAQARFRVRALLIVRIEID